MADAIREFFRPSQAPHVIGVSRDTIYRWQREGKIKLTKLHGITLVPMSEIRKHLEPVGDQLGGSSE